MSLDGADGVDGGGGVADTGSDVGGTQGPDPSSPGNTTGDDGDRGGRTNTDRATDGEAARDAMSSPDGQQMGNDLAAQVGGDEDDDEPAEQDRADAPGGAPSGSGGANGAGAQQAADAATDALAEDPVEQAAREQAEALDAEHAERDRAQAAREAHDRAQSQMAQDQAALAQDVARGDAERAAQERAQDAQAAQDLAEQLAQAAADAPAEGVIPADDALGHTQLGAAPAYEDFAGADAHGGMVITEDVLISDGIRMDGGVTIIDPAAPGLPTFGIPARPGQGEYSSKDWTYHEYDYSFALDGRLRGTDGLAAVERALIENPTPGDDRPASVNGTLNDVGDLSVPGGRDNVPWADSNPVHSYVVGNPDLEETDYVVNYTVEGEHFVDDGMVMRYGRLEDDGTITLRNYGEGNGLAQGLPVLGSIADAAARDVWEHNSEEVAARALSILNGGN